MPNSHSIVLKHAKPKVKGNIVRAAVIDNRLSAFGLRVLSVKRTFRSKGSTLLYKDDISFAVLQSCLVA